MKIKKTLAKIGNFIYKLATKTIGLCYIIGLLLFMFGWSLLLGITLELHPELEGQIYLIARFIHYWFWIFVIALVIKLIRDDWRKLRWEQKKIK